MSQIAYYPFDGNVKDRSGGNNDGTATNVSFVAGQFGQAASFNGASSRVSASSISLLDLGSSWSISFHVKIAASTGNFQFIFSHVIDANNVITIFFFDTTIRAGVHNGVGFTQVATSPTISFGIWYHVVMTWDGSSVVKLYLDGVLQSGVKSTTNYGTTVGLSIGSRVDSSRWANGLIDELRTHNEELTVVQANLLFHHNYLKVLALSI